MYNQRSHCMLRRVAHAAPHAHVVPLLMQAAMAAREAERAACEESGEAGYRGQSSTVPMEVSGEGGETQTGTVTHFGTPAGSPTPSDGDTAPAISREKAKRTRRPLQLFPCDKLY